MLRDSRMADGRIDSAHPRCGPITIHESPFTPFGERGENTYL